MSVQLKAVKRVLLAAGYTSAEISELVRGIKADAWDKGYWHGINGHTGPGNPYRDINASEPTP